MMLDATSDLIDGERERDGRAERDVETVRAVLAGDVDRFSELVDRYGGLVFSIVGRRVLADEVETVAQETFLRAYRSLSHFSLKKPFERWLTTIALRSCCDFWRKHGRRRSAVVEGTNSAEVEWFDGLVANWSGEAWELENKRKDLLELLDHALERLRAEDRMVLELTYFDGLTMKEAAVKLNWSVSNVKIRAMRARFKLRRILSKLMK